MHLNRTKVCSCLLLHNLLHLLSDISLIELVRKEQKRKQELIDSLDDALGVTGELDDLDEWLKANSEEKFDEEMDKYLKSGEFEFIDQRILEAEDVAPHVSTSVPEMKAEEAPNSEYQRVQEDEKVEEEEGW